MSKYLFFFSGSFSSLGSIAFRNDYYTHCVVLFLISLGLYLWGCYKND